jgi:hypothetical protein
LHPALTSAINTGLAYIDVKQLTSSNIVNGIDGQYWISTHRQKTDTPSKIPLLDTARHIIEKYADHPKSNNEGTLADDEFDPVCLRGKYWEFIKEDIVEAVERHYGA